MYNNIKLLVAILILILINSFVPYTLSKGLTHTPKNFILSNIHGDNISLNDYLGKKVVFINFWATWCPSCKIQMSELNDVDKVFKESQSVILLNINLGESTKKISKYLKDNNLDLYVLKDITRSVEKKYNIISIPSTVVIDLEGKIIQTKIGVANSEFFLNHEVLKNLNIPKLEQTPVYEKPDIELYINGSILSSENLPIIKNDRTLLPLRILATSLGYPNNDSHIIWNEFTKTVTLKNESKTIILRIGSRNIYVNNDLNIIDVEPIIFNNRTYVPVRFIAEVLNKNVYWDNITKTIHITDN